MAKAQKKRKKIAAKKSAVPSFDSQLGAQRNTFATGPAKKGGFTPTNKRSTQGSRKR